MNLLMVRDCFRIRHFQCQLFHLAESSLHDLIAEYQQVNNFDAKETFAESSTK